jgi:meiotic recombination protein REC8, fungi type
MDDPAFMPDMDLPALDFDFSSLHLDMNALGGPQKSSLLSPFSQNRRDSSTSHAGSIVGLNIPHSSSVVSYQFPYNDPFQLGTLSAQKTPMASRLFEDEEEKLLDDFDFVFDANGEIRDINPVERELIRSGTVMSELGRLGSDSVAGGRVRREYEGPAGLLLSQGRDYVMIPNDEPNILPETEPFPAMIAGIRQGRLNTDSSKSNEEESSSVSAKARLWTRKRKVIKALPVDQSTSLRNADLRDWQDSYAQNMLAAIQKKETQHTARVAKRNAYEWVFGNGLGNVGNGIGGSKLPSPLALFAGDSLMSLVVGAPTISTAHSPKRAREDNLTPLDRNVRPKISQNLDQIGRGDDAFVPQFEDSTGVEVGREAPTALEDHPVSAMPWNISSSLHSYRNLPAGSSVHGPGTATGRPSSIHSARPGSRLTSASPLFGRGRASAEGNIPDFGGLDEIGDLPGLPGYSDPIVRRGRTLSASHTAVEEFEIFGPSAAVDTQTAQGTQWVRDALARESMNFLEFVRNTLTEGKVNELVDDADPLGQTTSGMSKIEKEVGFEALFPPESNSMMVAAQAFHHVLTLATKNLLSVRQEIPFGEIYLSVAA